MEPSTGLTVWTLVACIAAIGFIKLARKKETGNKNNSLKNQKVTPRDDLIDRRY